MIRVSLLSITFKIFTLYVLFWKKINDNLYKGVSYLYPMDAFGDGGRCSIFMEDCHTLTVPHWVPGAVILVLPFYFPCLP